MLTLHLVRHGDTSQAADGIFSGDLDPPLTDSGRAQAERLAVATRALALTAIHCSPKVRAQLTAAPTARACGLTPVLEDGLREIAYGRWEGRKETEIRETEPDAYRAWRDDPAMTSPPGGENACAIAARAMPVVSRLIHGGATGNVMLVSHKATVRIPGVRFLLGATARPVPDACRVPTASITSFEFRDGVPMLVRVADVHHLA